VPRDLFVAALEKEGIPCDGRFYEPVYKSDLFYATPDNSPQLRIGRHETMHYDMVHSSVAERAAYEEAVWLPQFLLIGGEADVRDVHIAIQKVLDNLDELAQADPSLAGAKAMGRAQRARFERRKDRRSGRGRDGHRSQWDSTLNSDFFASAVRRRAPWAGRESRS
jgi:hypothetical protein